MGTHAIISLGITSQYGEWKEENAFYKHYDGFPEAIVPILKENADNLSNLDNVDIDNKFEKLPDGYDRRLGEFFYFIDVSNKVCTVLGLDWDFLSKFMLDHYKVLDVVKLK